MQFLFKFFHEKLLRWTNQSCAIKIKLYIIESDMVCYTVFYVYMSRIQDLKSIIIYLQDCILAACPRAWGLRPCLSTSGPWRMTTLSTGCYRSRSPSSSTSSPSAASTPVGGQAPLNLDLYRFTCRDTAVRWLPCNSLPD